MIDDPNTFKNYAVASPSLSWGNNYTIKYLEAKLDSLNLEDKNLIYSYENPTNSDIFRGLRFETLPDSLDIKKVEKLFEQKETKLNRQFFYYPNYNHVNMVPVAINDAIVTLFSFYPLDSEALAGFFEDSPQALIQFIDTHFKNVSEKLGYEVLPEEGFLRGYAAYIDNFMKDKLEYSEALKSKADILYNSTHKK